MKKELSNRGWYGMLGAALWGAVLGLVPFDKFGAFALFVAVVEGLVFRVILSGPCQLSISP